MRYCLQGVTSTAHSSHSVCLFVYTLCLFDTNSEQLLSCMGESNSVIFYLVWYKTGIKDRWRTAGCREHRPCPRGYFTLHFACEPMWAHQTPEPKCSRAVSHSTVLSRPPSNQKVQNREAGSVAYRIYYSLPPTGSSFVAFSRFFSSTLYSFSVLSHVSSDKRQRDYLSAFKSLTEPLVSTASPTDRQPPRATADKKTVFQLWISTTEQLLLEIKHFWGTQDIYKQSWKSGLELQLQFLFDFKVCSGFTQFVHAGSHTASAPHQIPTSPVSPDFSRMCAHLPERRKVGLTFLNQDLHLTPSSSVLQVPEPGQSKQQPSVIKALGVFNPHIFFTPLAEKPIEIPIQHP